MESVVEVLVVWLLASPVVAVLVGTAISRAAAAAEARGEAAPGPLPDLSLIPAQATTSPEVLRLGILPRS
ncbi:hypothetical protein ACUN7V_08000 [Quadrisphaera oryzae]|uniref:hypothetical protein n=1 Tax=Quadrisphaera TaxID=317661 RepID=UPI0016488548|nr:hypothetical protein [Quadrisphaera sp. RL12-1S]MBC3761672.1 hypothetical protein [Quadrisphaera sp. RL12-1S]